MILLELLAWLGLPALGLALYRMGYEVGLQAARADDDRDDDGPIAMEHTHGGEEDV